ncbi:MAG: trypsin-like peptidase domain-containing protein [Clostridia bacterium]|nr:trypsin-like peptidase domain-containing protein [Clostridia bacterium]
MFDENGKYIGETQENEIEIIEEQAEEAADEKAEPLFTNDFVIEEKPKRKRNGFFKKAVSVAVCACVAGAAFSVAMNVTDKFVDNIKIGTTQDALSENNEIKLSYSAMTTAEGELSIEKIAEACLPSVVSITNKGVSEIMTFFGNYQTESISSGSGIIIGENDSELLIVTNYHVVADSKELTVVFSHEEAETKDGEESYMNIAKVKGYDADKDIAVIAVNLDEISSETKSKIKIATIGDSKEIKLGGGVVAIGNALGYGQSVTHGIISAIDREVTMDGIKGGEITNKYLQTDAAINSGNSGGALLNMKGELIGINSAKIAASGVEGMGYAIPITDVQELIGELMTLKTRDVVPEDKRGYLGIYGTDVTSQVSQMYSMPQGVFVQEAIKDSPAEKSDLAQGDIITKIDNVSVTTMAALQDRLSRYEAGESVVLSVKRIEGRKYVDVDVTVVLGSKKDAGIEE